ncbi:hypothetical protein BOX15_Mlig026707g2, partial [Macrostomum lignano]
KLKICYLLPLQQVISFSSQTMFKEEAVWPTYTYFNMGRGTSVTLHDRFTRLKLQAAYLAEKNLSLQNLDGNQRRPDDAASQEAGRRGFGAKSEPTDRWRGVADGRVQRRHQGFHGGANSAGSGGGSVGGTGGSGGGCRISQAFRSALKGSDRGTAERWLGSGCHSNSSVIEASHAQRPVGANSNWRRPERRVPCRRELDRDIDQYMSGGQSSSEDSG